jgi:hypothetical protein
MTVLHLGGDSAVHEALQDAAGTTGVVATGGNSSVAEGWDRIVVSVMRRDVPLRWLEKLLPEATLTVPVRISGAVCRVMTFTPCSTGWVSVTVEPVPPAPATGEAVGRVPVTRAGDAWLVTYGEQHAAPYDALEYPPRFRWTGISLVPGESLAGLEVFLAEALPGGVVPLHVDADVIRRGAADPMFGWGAPCTAQGTSIAYLTRRPVATGGGRLNELGVAGHGPAADAIAHRTAQVITEWGEGLRSAEPRFMITRPDPEGPSVCAVAAVWGGPSPAARDLTGG